MDNKSFIAGLLIGQSSGVENGYDVGDIIPFNKIKPVLATTDQTFKYLIL